jgi:very-short-patch-repair endonuclease
MITANKTLARSLRKNVTWAEKKLWIHLRNHKMAGFKFRRQQNLGSYILDFYCAEKRFCVEIDGGQHDMPEHIDLDRKREEFLRSEGIRTVRFWNSQIRENLPGVLQRIRGELVGKPSPYPSPLKGKGTGFSGRKKQVSEDDE